jgi:hypothetical protein
MTSSAMPILRLARPAEADAIDALLKASTADLFPAYDDEARDNRAVRGRC